MPPEFAITEQGAEAGHHVIAVRGEIDLFTAPELKSALTESLELGTGEDAATEVRMTFRIERG